jgi:hypothetical protein
MRTQLTTLVTITALFPAMAMANSSNCGDREAVVKRLSTGYGESFTGGGLRNTEAIFEVWASEEAGTWTILMTLPSGQTCVMAAGTDWRGALPETPAGIPG